MAYVKRRFGGPGAPYLSLYDARPASRSLTPITIVVPCHNDSGRLVFLANTLQGVERTLAARYVVSFVFVDDASTDESWDMLRRAVGAWRNCAIVRKPVSHGIAAAIETGISVAKTEIVCSISSNCACDPHQLRIMIPLLAPGVDLVTAAPYHQFGEVRGNPLWRSIADRTLSALYARLTDRRLTSASCPLRVYRRRVAMDVPLQHGGRVGLAELLCKLGLTGASIIEHPVRWDAELERDHSLLSAIRSIPAHLRLVVALLVLRSTVREFGLENEPAPSVPRTTPLALLRAQ